MRRNIIVVDRRRRFLADLQSASIMLDHDGINFEIVKTIDHLDDIANALTAYQADELLLGENILQECSLEGFNASYLDFGGVQVTCYGSTAKGASLAQDFRLPYYGETTSARKLYQLLNVQPFEAASKDEVYDPNEDVSEEEVSNADIQEEVLLNEQETDSVIEKQSPPPSRPKRSGQRQTRGQQKQGTPSKEERRSRAYSLDQPAARGSRTTFRPAGHRRPAPEKTGRLDTKGKQKPMDVRKIERHPETNEQPESDGVLEFEDESITDTSFHRPEVSLRKQINKRNAIEEQHYEETAGRRFQKAISLKKKTTVCAFYAGKGGVGKTTMVTETGTYLSLVEQGRGTNQVCIVDYNIDFSDVGTVLDLENDGGMVYWAHDIRERIENGEDPTRIRYTKEEVRSFLVQMPDTTLYCLLGPDNNLDSYDINEEELQIMLRNIIENGGFDFVICDSGNNTRDCSSIALQAADMVFLLTTQEVTTAKCDVNAIEALTEIGFDTSKVRLVINRVVPTKVAGISVEEIEAYFKEYECVAHIRENPDVTKANNQGSPLVFTPNHSFTKEIQELAGYLLDEIKESVIATKGKKKKAGFFKRLFGRA